MGRLARYVILSASLMICLAFMPSQVPAQNIDAKIKSLEQLESRIDAKLKRLDELEARLEARLATTPQPVAARGPGGVPAGGNGQVSMPTGIMTGSAAGAGPGGGGLWGGQVAFRGGYAKLDGDGGSAFGTGGSNQGWWVGGALDIPLMKDPFFNNTLLGQISLDVIGTGNKTSGILDLDRTASQNLLKIAISPKYRIETLGAIRPWIIPIGLSFVLNSPPSSGVTYLDVGGTTGFGVEYVLPVLGNHLSLGLAFAYNFYPSDRNHLNTNNINVGPYVGINF